MNGQRTILFFVLRSAELDQWIVSAPALNDTRPYCDQDARCQQSFVSTCCYCIALLLSATNECNLDETACSMRFETIESMANGLREERSIWQSRQLRWRGHGQLAGAACVIG